MSAPKNIKPKVVSRGHVGSPKKGGGGGKGTWGKGGLDDLYIPKVSPKDPIFDEQLDAEDYDEDDSKEENLIPVSPIEPTIRDYFISGDVDEVAATLKEKLKPDDYPNFVRKCMVYAMEQHGYEREIVSRLFVALYNKPINIDQFCDGFQQALNLVTDIVLDSPDAVDLLGKFLARAILDEVVPPSFLKGAATETEKAKEVISLANGLLNEPHRSERILHIWGPGDLSSVKRLKQEVGLLIEEFLVNSDVKELDLNVRKLNAPSFYFEVVKQTIRLWIQKETEKKVDQGKQLWKLLEYLDSSNLIGKDHFEKGIGLLVVNLPDLILDLPSAGSLLTEAIELAMTNNFISKGRAKVFTDRITKIEKAKKPDTK